MNKKEIAFQIIEDTFNKKVFNTEVLRHFDKHTMTHAIVGKILGREETVQAIRDWVLAFPDFKLLHSNIQEDKNRVIMSLKADSTHLNSYQSKGKGFIYKTILFDQLETLPPTYKKLSYLVEATIVFNQKKL